MVRFGTDRAKDLLARVGFNGDQSIRNKMLSNSIETAQKRVEGNNFDIDALPDDILLDEDI